MSIKLRVTAGVILIAALCGCTNKDVEGGDTPASPADEMAGNFSGTGNYMPGNVQLNTSGACTLPSDWSTYYKTGAATAAVTKVNDSTVTITLSGVIPVSNYGNASVRLDNGRIAFANGYYDPSTKQLFFADKGVCTYSGGCNFCNQSVSYFPPGFSPGAPAQYFSVATKAFTGTKQ